MDVMRYSKLAGACALFLALAEGSRAVAINIPLTIQELLPANDAGGYPPSDVTGLGRTAEPVTFGVPLQDGDNITSASQLAVISVQGGQPVPAQFRILRRYPDNNVQWVLVDLQASVAANATNTQYALATGSNPGTGTMGSDSGTAITVNTGAAVFGIVKARQNVLNSASVGGTTFLQAGHPGGIVFTDLSGTVYRSDNDSNSTAVIEEDGPLRAVVREQGRLVSASGVTHMGYTVRLSFYRGKSYVRVQTSIENAFLDDYTRQYLGSIRLDVPTVLAGSLGWTIGTQSSTMTGTLAQSSDSVFLYEAQTTHGQDSNAVRVSSTHAIPFYQATGDFGAPFTTATLTIPVPPCTGCSTQSSATFPATLVGTTLKLTVDGTTASATFTSGSFSQPAAPKPNEVATVIQNAFKSLNVSSYWEGNYGSDPGAVIIRDSGTAGHTSMVVGSGTANAALGLAGAQGADGQNGFEIVQNTSVLHALAGTSEYARGFGDLHAGAGTGVSIAVRNFDSFFPDAIEFDGNGTVSFEIVSKHDSRQGMYFDWEEHETRDVTLDFHVSANDATADYYRIQYPLFGRAPFEQYVVTGGFLGKTHLVDFQTLQNYYASNAIKGINQWAGANQPTYGITSFALPNAQIIRRRTFSWGTSGSQTNSDHTVGELLGFLQTGAGGLFQTAYDIGYFVVDLAVHHSDRADRANWPTGLETPPGAIYNQFNGGQIGSTLFQDKFEDDMEHMNVLGVPLLYYLTGDQFIYEGLVDLGEWLAHDKPFYQVNCDPGQRGHPQRGKWFSALYWMTGDPRYKAQLDIFVNNLLCAVIPEGTQGCYGQDSDRGVFINSLQCPPNEPWREVHSPIESPVRSEGTLEAYHALPDSDPRKEELGDRLVGFAYFGALEYYWDRNGSLCNANGWPSPTQAYYFVDRTPTGDFTTSNYLPLEEWQALFAYGYQMTHDPWFLYVNRRTVGAVGSGSALKCNDGPNGATETVGRQTYDAYDNWGEHDAIWSDLNQNAFGSVFLNDDANTMGGLSVTNKGNGSYVLSWTVPPNAVRYQVKYGPQIMVPNLGFNKLTRSYIYSPAHYDNFWAGDNTRCSAGSGNADWPCVSNADCTNGGTCAGSVADQPRNVQGEPTPAAAGTTQTFTVSGLNPTPAYHFAMRVYTSSPGSGGTTLLAPPRPTPPRGR